MVVFESKWIAGRLPAAADFGPRVSKIEYVYGDKFVFLRPWLVLVKPAVEGKVWP